MTEQQKQELIKAAIKYVYDMTQIDDSLLTLIHVWTGIDEFRIEQMYKEIYMNMGK